MKRRLLLALQIIGTLVLVGVAIQALDLGATAETLLTADPGLTLVGFALLLVGQVVSALRWRELAAHAGVAGSAGWFARVYLRGCFYNSVLPTGLGGDAVRVMLLRKVASTGTATRSVVADRLLGFVALAVTAAFVVPFTAYLAMETLSVLALVSLVAIGIGLGVLASAGRISGWVARTAGWTLAYEVIWFAGVWFLAAAVGIAISPAALPVVVLVVGVALALPLSIGGTGAREGAFVLALAPLGVAAETAVALGVLFGLALAAVGLVGAVVRVSPEEPADGLAHAESPIALSAEVAR
jgi:uncharacterized membrane protein YbhN (UPF0104 family)